MDATAEGCGRTQATAAASEDKSCTQSQSPCRDVQPPPAATETSVCCDADAGTDADQYSAVRCHASTHCLNMYRKAA